MSTETTNKKIKIDNGTTFGRTYTDKAVDELLKNIGGGGKLEGFTINVSSTYNPETKSFSGTLTDEQWTKVQNEQIYWIEVVYINNQETGEEASTTLLYNGPFFGEARMFGDGNGSMMLIQDKSVEGMIIKAALTIDTQGTPTSQLIPSITTSNTQQNLTIGNGLAIENGALISNLSNFKYGTLRLKNITSNTESYTIELSFFDYIYDVIINGASQLMGTSLTRDTFPSFLKNNITPQLFITLITNIIDVHRKVALMPYFDVTIIDQTNNAILANCSTTVEGGVAFFCGTNEINLPNPTFGDTFTVEYYGSWYGD